MARHLRVVVFVAALLSAMVGGAGVRAGHAHADTCLACDTAAGSVHGAPGVGPNPGPNPAPNQ